MPKGDQTRPSGNGTGRGIGIERGEKWTEGKGFGAGPGGYCICQYCGFMEQHQLGRPCFMKKCPKCGEIMTREWTAAGGRDER